MTESRKQAVMRRLRELSGENGTLTPEAVVADATSPTSVLHSCFEWDDTKAAHQHRLDQARGLIRIRMTTVVDEVEVRAPSYLRTPGAESKDQGYTSTLKLRDDKEAARVALRAEIGRVVSALERARDIAAVLGLAGELGDMIKAATKVQAATVESFDAVAKG